MALCGGVPTLGEGARGDGESVPGFWGDATAQVTVKPKELTEMLERVIGIMDWSAVSQNTPKEVMDRKIPAPMLVKSVHAKRCNQGLAMVMRCTKGVTFDVVVGEGAAEVRERDERMRAAFALATFLNATLNPRKELVAAWAQDNTYQKKGSAGGDGNKATNRGSRTTRRGASKRRNANERNPRKELVAIWTGNETIITEYNSQKKNLNIQNTSFQE